MSSEPALVVKGLHKVFPIYDQPHKRLLELIDPRPGLRWRREFHALRGIDFEIPKGHTIGIVGRNGAGKSTLLQIICGTLAPSAGSVEVHGRMAALLELGAGFNPEFTGRENVYLNATILGLSRAEIDARLDDILAFADIGQFIDQPVKSYSSGMYVRLAFSVAINVTPEILIVDEALSVGDEAFQRKCFSRIEKIRESGATVLFVSHSAGTVVDLCDHALLIDGGELLMHGTPKRVVTLYQKLVYARPDQQPAIREAIRHGGREAAALLATEAAATQRRSDADPPVSIDGLAEPRIQAWYDPELRPVSTVAYANKGAVIEDVRVETPDGRRVNMLVHGEEYVYRYGIKVERTLARMRVGMMIRTTTGVEVGGTVTPRDEPRMDLVPAGAELEVAFRFRCLLNPGTYFLNAGCLADTGDHEEYIDRRIDVAMLRVMPDPALTGTAIVDLLVDSSVEWQA